MSAPLTATHAVHMIGSYPHQFVIHAEGKRRAQIIARLLGERFPQTPFTYCEGVDTGAPFANGFILDSAASVEVQRLADADLKAEAEAGTNPEGREKWLLFIFDSGKGPQGGLQMSCYLEHDRSVVERCKADPYLAATIEIFSEYPGTDELIARLDDWRSVA